MAAIRVTHLSLSPLGAGDLIDRAVRLYRHHFMTLIRITAPPVIVSAVGSVLTTVSWRELWATSESLQMFLFFVLLVLGLACWFGGNLSSMIVMGGATRNLVMHLIWNEPVSVRATYVAVRSRFWGLLGASLVVTLFAGICGLVALIIWYMTFAFLVIAAVAVAFVSSWLAAVLGILVFVLATGFAFWLFFFLVGKLAYVPQVMLVEGKGVFESISRSTALARGNVRRLMAVAFFYSFATYSALMLLLIPLGWYGYLHGIDPSPWRQADWPAWYAIGYNVLWQSSVIMLAPVWMLGLSLLYVDERVRHEGYDIELMAARQLGEMPNLPRGHATPFAPALVNGRAEPTPLAPPQQAHAPRRSPNSTLGLS